MKRLHLVEEGNVHNFTGEHSLQQGQADLQGAAGSPSPGQLLVNDLVVG